MSLTKGWTPLLPRFVLGWCLVLAFLAAAGGGSLMAAPSGEILGLSLEWLDKTPFDDFFIPGLLLFAVVGGSYLLAALCLIFLPLWARLAVFFAGATLSVWIVVQIALLGLAMWLQPVLLAGGVFTIGLAWRLRL